MSNQVIPSQVLVEREGHLAAVASQHVAVAIGRIRRRQQVVAGELVVADAGQRHFLGIEVGDHERERHPTARLRHRVDARRLADRDVRQEIQRGHRVIVTVTIFSTVVIDDCHRRNIYVRLITVQRQIAVDRETERLAGFQIY